MPYSRKEDLQSLILEAVSRINSGVSKTLTARKTSEVPPQDTRHLTDTRTRVSTLLEYSLSYELNHLFIEKEISYSISNVLWNVFPDLVVRDSAFNNVIGLEVKALHSAAEEKSANLHTPISLIRKDKDFIVILAWGWNRLQKDGLDITYPHIHDFCIFDAWLIAKMRDSTWLINNNDRIKGIDISTPIINSDGDGYKAEEGNLGKLMRIHMSDQTSENMPSYESMKREADAYAIFKDKILLLGLIETIKDINSNLSGSLKLIDEPIKPSTIAALIGITEIPGKNIFYVTGSIRANIHWSQVIEELQTGDIIVQLGNKLEWKILKWSDEWLVVDSGKKPDIELKRICSSIFAK